LDDIEVEAVGENMTLAGKRVFVTGGTGFLGGALVPRLASEGAHIRVVARNPQKGRYIQNLPKVEIIQGDITQADSMHEAVRGCEIVFHVAASTGGSIDLQRQMNTIGTRNVAQAAASAGVMRFVHVSTVAVYGYRQQGDVTEDTPLDPGQDPYNITKAEAEHELRQIAAEHRMPYSIIRPSMIYGPRSGMWTGVLFKVARRRPTLFLGSGDGTTFPIYVDDVVDLMITLAEHPEAVGEAFNCSPDPSPTWREFLGAYSRLAGHQGWLGFPPALAYPVANLVSALARPETQLKEAGNFVRLTQSNVTFKMTKARDRLGWQAKIGLEEGVKQCEPWLRQKGLLK
jgi:nucleoside-diphosphate-sugar epimerase